MSVIQSRTRLQIRQDIGRMLGVLIPGTATAISTDHFTITDAKYLTRGATNEYRGRQFVFIASAGTSAVVAGEWSYVASSATTGIITLQSTLTDDVETGDTYELWQVFDKEDIDALINQAIMEVSDDCLQLKQSTSVFTDSGIYEYDVLSSFKGLHKVEYAYSSVNHDIDRCETAWTAGTAGTTVTADTAFKKEGTASAKFVTVSVGATTILGYKAISSLDISDCDKIEFWMYSSIALTAGQLQIKLDDTAAIASSLEAINIPAMTAATWYRHSLSLANPHLDTAIISVGIYQVADVADATLYVDAIRAVKSDSIVYKTLNPQQWNIVKGSTAYLKLTPDGLGVIGNPTQLRLTGYQLPVLLNADATTSEIDPQWLVNKVVGEALLNHAKSSQLGIGDRIAQADRRLAKAEKDKVGITTAILPNTRWTT